MWRLGTCAGTVRRASDPLRNESYVERGANGERSILVNDKVLEALRKREPVPVLIRCTLCNKYGSEICEGRTCHDCCLYTVAYSGYDTHPKEYNKLLHNLRKHTDELPVKEYTLSSFGTRLEKYLRRKAHVYTSFSAWIRYMTCRCIAPDCGNKERSPDCRGCCLYENDEEAIREFNSILRILRQERDR